MTSGVSGGPSNTSSSPTMQVGQQHSMSSSGSQQAPGPPSQGSDQQQLMSPAGAASAGANQSVPMGQPMTAGGFQPTIISSPLGAPNAAAAQYQYVVINQQGQAVLQPANFSFPGMSAMPTAQNPGQQYIITSSLPQAAKQGSQPHLMTTGAPVSMSQTVSKSLATQQPTYTLSSAGLMSQAGGPQPQTFMIAHQMGGSPTLQAAASNMVTNTSMPSHIKAEPGKQMHQQATQQPQQVGAQQPMILPPGMTYVNTQQPGQAFIQNGQIFVRAPPPQDGQATSQLMFSPQAMQMQPQPTLQPGLATQQLPPGLTTSMQPMTSMAVTSGSTVVRAPMAYPSPIPSGKTQISRAPPTLLPATSASSSTTSRGSTSSASFMTQPSPKSKQKMSPRQPPLSTKGMTTAQATKSILNSIKNQVGASVSPPVLTSSASPLSLAPGSPSAGGPPVLQTSALTAPPPPNSHSQPPLLHPMMMPTSGSNTTTSSFVNGKPMTIAHTMPSNSFKPLDTSGKVPIMPSIKKAVNNSMNSTSAAPMEPISKSVDSSNDNKNGMKPPQECLTHVIDGHVIHESSQPFPLQDDIKGRHRKKSESKQQHQQSASLGSSVAPSLVPNSRPLTTAPPSSSVTPTSTAPNLPPSSRQDSSEKKRGPGRPPGSTKQNIEQQRLLQQQQQALQSNDIVKVSKDGGPVNKKAKTDFESSPPALATKPVSEVKAKYNIDVTTNNPLKWNVTQVCDFVKNLPGCSDYVEDFQLQEIDGQALMLLKADHLMSAMAIKLGPALKICNAIEAMREELKQN